MQYLRSAPFLSLCNYFIFHFPGFLSDVSDKFVSILLDKNLTEWYEFHLLAKFVLSVRDGCCHFLSNADGCERHFFFSYHHINSDNQGLYRIDKAEISTSAVMQWSNLAKLFFADSEQDAKLRRLIVNLESPTFARQKDLLSSVTSSQVCEVWSSQLSAW